MKKINIVQIQSALLVPITAQFIVDKLGVKPVEQEKRAMFWSDAQYLDICQRLIAHITARRDLDINSISGQRPKKEEVAPEPQASAGDAFFGGDDTPAGSASASDDDTFDFGDAEPAVEEFF
jgi:hypothetical protein